LTFLVSAKTLFKTKFDDAPCMMHHRQKVITVSQKSMNILLKSSQIAETLIIIIK
jgi:hypothetical protein